jgi:type I restriction enzyme S subunit
VVGGGTPSTKDPSNFDGGEIPWITPADLSGYSKKYIESGARSITKKGLESSGARLMPEGTVLFSSRAPIGYVAIARRPVSTNQGFKSFIPPKGIRSDYLYHYLQRAKELAVELSSGTTFQEISGKRAAQIPLAIPPESEQERLVAKLEELLSDLDVGRTAVERARTNLKRYRAAVLKAAVEGRLTEKWRAARPDVEPAEKLLERILAEQRKKWEEAQLVKYAEKKQAPPKGWKEKYSEPVKPDLKELSELPKGWCWAALDQLAEIGTGATPLRSEQRYWREGSIPWVTSAVVNDSFVQEPSELVTSAALEETNLFLYPRHTLVLAMYGEGKTRGKVSELLIEATTNQALAALVLEGSAATCRNYVKTFLAKSYEDMRRIAAGGVQPNLNLGLIKEMAVPLPPVREQAAIASAIDRMLSVQERVVEEAGKSVDRSARLRQAILKRAFEGKLVPQDPKDEPASELLARIRADRFAKGHAKEVRARGKKIPKTCT